MNKRAFIVTGGVVAIALLLTIAIFYVVTVLNPKADDNQKELRGVGSAVHKVICAQAQIQANSYRIRQTDEHGNLEPVAHFLRRMQAQRTLLSLALGLGCENTPGFPPFEIQVARALLEIRDILNDYQPEPKHKGTTDHNPLLERGPIPSVLFPHFSPPEVQPVGGQDQGTPPAGTKQSPKSTEPQPGGKAPPAGSAPSSPPTTNPEAIPAEEGDSGPGSSEAESPKGKTENLPGVVKEVLPPVACPLVDKAAGLCH